MVRDLRLQLCVVAFVAAFASRPVLAADQVHDEIQVYNAEIAEVGQWTYEQHFNYAAVGQTQPEVPGGFSSNRSLQGTPEFAYGITDWWEGGFYIPFAVDSSGQLLSDGAKIRSLFVVPDAAKRSFFYGVNFELGYEMPRFASSPWGLEIRPIVGVRNSAVGVHRQPDRGCKLRRGRRSGFRAGAPSRPQSRQRLVCRSRILRRFRQDRRFPAACSNKASNCLRSRISKRASSTSSLASATASPADRTGSSPRRSRLRVSGARQRQRRQYGAEARHGDGGAIDAGRLEHEIASHYAALSREAR